MRIEFNGHNCIATKVNEYTYEVKCPDCEYKATWRIDIKSLLASVVVQVKGNTLVPHSFQLESALTQDFGDQRN